MENSNELVSTVLTDLHQVSSLKVAAAAYASWRARLIREERRVITRVWNLRDWMFTYVEANDILIPAGQSDFDLTTPAAGSWVTDGQDGGLWMTAEPQSPLEWRRPGIINSMLQANPTETGVPRLYTVTGQRTLRVFPRVAADTPFFAIYKRTPPAPSDTASSGAGDDGLQLIPIQWRESVVYEWVVLREMRAKGDLASIPAQAEEVKQGIFDMCCGERQGKPWEQNMPRFPGSADVGPGDLFL